MFQEAQDRPVGHIGHAGLAEALLDELLGGENGELRAGNQRLEEVVKEIPQAVIGDAAVGQDGPEIAVAAQGRELGNGQGPDDFLKESAPFKGLDRRDGEAGGVPDGLPECALLVVIGPDGDQKNGVRAGVSLPQDTGGLCPPLPLHHFADQTPHRLDFRLVRAYLTDEVNPIDPRAEILFPLL
ncbi:MAG: hypothetical protein QHJ34_03040 [bacterium]|nr:hypothetical protein [candidate division KSB1 bacterium]MDH7559195.1 hypothetical protein [bacterium]